MTRKLPLLSLLLAVAASLTQTYAEETIPLEEIQPGDSGEWRTVVSGSEVESFPLTVVGILDSFAGAGVPVILCRASDSINTATGPVSGMSGSPVYIKGRLAGAYAYGFPWSKDKTLIGVTPIGKMEPLFNYPDIPYRDALNAPIANSETTASLGLPNNFSSIRTSTESTSSPRPLPIPLLASGISAKTLDAIQPWLEKNNLFVTAGAGGRTKKTDADFEAGSPLAVILASGDLTLGGVGTITRREGDRVIAFGHPMLSAGSVELPIGSAEVVDVVSSYRISFKLSNIGEVAGTLWQDSTTGIQAELGRIPYMIPITIHSDAAIKNPIEGKLAEHRDLTPSMALTYAAEGILTSREGPDEATVRGQLSIDIDGYDEPLEFSRVGVGFTGAIDLLFTFSDYLNAVVKGSQEFPRLKNISYDFKTENEEKRQLLHSIRLESSRIQADKPVELTIVTRKRNGELAHHTVEVPLPDAPDGSSFSLFVADADTLRSFDQIATYNPTRSLDQLITELRQIKDNGSIYVQLLRPSPGLRLDGRNLEELPPSVLRLYQSSLEKPGEKMLRESIVWETAIPVPGEFSGSSRIQFTTEP